jgi:phosphopantothenoylcysteine synthetase/decarboxylase
MAKVARESLELCKRVDSLLQKATADPDSFYEYAMDNDEITKYAFLARAVVRALIDPSPELLAAIAEIEEEFAEYANQVEAVADDDEDDDDDDDEEDEEDEEEDE